MLHYWLIVSLSGISSVSLQYISSAYEDQLGPASNSVLNTLDPVLNHPLPNSNYFNLPPNLESHERETKTFNILFPEMLLPQNVRARRTPEVPKAEVTYAQFSNLADADGPPSEPSDARISSIPLIVRNEEFSGAVENNGSQRVKKSFSPWGGKRDVSNMWTWKRASAMREPSMPKRVRFSPWGGKRSSQLIFKPGAKAAKIIFSKSFPELTRILSSYSPKGGINLAGFQMLPLMDKRNPIRILAMTSKLQGNDVSPFSAFIESTKMYKSGHPYTDINLWKDDKRKVKFSAWGGKRSPPIIGPIWSPSTQTIQDHTLDTILLIRKNEAEKDKMTKAF